MKKSQILVATLCASALVLSACTIGRKPSKKKKSSSQDVPTSVVPGPTSSGTTTSGTSGTPTPTPTSGTSTAPVKVVQRIDVTTAPTKTEYTAGQNFDPTGMVVTATYSDGSTATVTDQCQFSPTVLTENTAAVTITFGGQSTTQAVTVNAPVPTSWSANQLEMLNYYLEDQGSQIPFKYVAGAELFRDAENAMLTYGDGSDTCSEDFIKEYVGLFSTDWNIEVNQLALAFADALIYEGSKTFNEGESNEVTVYVSFYGLGDDGYITSDGTGHFGLDIYDDFYYSWEEFAPLYQEALDTVYDTTTEEGEAVAFPDPVAFEGETSLIEVNDQLDSTSSYLVAYLYGVSQADYLAYTDSFYDSGKWTPYTDTLQGCEAFYHESEKVSVGYLYYSSQSVLAIIIYQYEKIYRAWSDVEEVIDAYIDTVNPETTVKVPAFEADSYVIEDHADSGYNGVFAFGTDEAPITQAMVDSYVAKFDPTVWTVEVKTEESEEEIRDDEGYLVWFETEAEAEAYITENSLENAHVESGEDEDGVYYYIVVATESSYYVASASDFSMNLQIAYNTMSSGGGYAAIIVIPRAPLTTTFPSEQILGLFTAGEITVENLPSYSTSEGKFLVDATEKYIGVEVFGSNSEEAAAYVTALTGNGWTVDEEASDSEQHLTVLMYGETMARCKVVDYSDEAGIHEVVIEFDIKVVDWSDDMKALFTAHLDGVIPPYFDAPLEYDADEDLFYFYVGSSATQELLNAYYAFQGDANWVQEGEYVSFSCESENGTAVAYWSSNGYFIIMLELNAWSESELADISTALHGVELPFVSGGLDSNASKPDQGYLEGGSYVSEETITAVETALGEAGWEKVTADDSYYFKKDSADGEGYAKFYWVKAASGTYFAAEFVAQDVPPTPGEAETVEKTVEEIATANSWVSGTIYSSFQLDENITVTASAGNNNGKYWEASGGKQYRLFQSESGTMTISAPDGYEIQSITLTFNYQETGILMYGDTQVTSGTAVEVNAQSATFTVSQTDSSKHGKIFITSFVVVYAPVSQ